MDIFSSPDVYQHEGPSRVEEPFFEDARGSIRRIDDGVHKVNLLYTKKGFMRSGDLHKNTQFDFLIQGKCELWLRIAGQDVKRVYEAHSYIEIPPGTPHLFIFLEDTYMLEWWDGEFEAWYYRPYREIIENKRPLPQ